MITFACDACGKPFQVKDEFAGRRTACPQCKKPIVVPQAETTVAGPQVGDTPSSPDGERSSLEFLAPRQQPDELGRLGGYRVLKVLGSGGMGVVLQAEDPALKRLVALKVMRPELAARETNRQRFLREAQATAAVEHAHIVPILHVGQEGQIPYIALPFLKGEPLDVRLKREPLLPVAEAVRIARQTAEGLAAAHAHGLIHRDIKPANLWLEAQTGVVKILDFGLARGLADEAHLTQSGTIVGTPAYMAPEQAGGETVDARCDLFSLGVVLYRMCTGNMPFKGQDTISLLKALATQTPTEPRQLNPEVPADLNALIMRLLARRADQRPASAAAVVEVLRAIQWDAEQTQAFSSSPLPHERVVGGKGAGPSRRRLPLLLALAGGLAAILVLGIVIFWPTLWGTRSGNPDGRVAASREVPLAKTFKNDLGMEFVLVPKGKFWMGGGGGKVGDKEVEIAEDFYLGKYEVTQEEWQKVTGLNPSSFKAVEGTPPEEQRRFPVENVSWDDCQEFVKVVNARVKEPGWVYRLPSEAEWEYACRGGPTSNIRDYGFDFYFEKPSLQLRPEQANFNSILKRTCKVGRYQPNKLGLYDMHGNVCEWCRDLLSEEGPDRVFRGGSWVNSGHSCRASDRYRSVPSSRSNSVGFRLARSSSP